MYQVKIEKLVCDCGFFSEKKDLEEPFGENDTWECPKCGNNFSVNRYKKEERKR